MPGTTHSGAQSGHDRPPPNNSGLSAYDRYMLATAASVGTVTVLLLVMMLFSQVGDPPGYLLHYYLGLPLQDDTSLDDLAGLGGRNSNISTQQS